MAILDEVLSEEYDRMKKMRVTMKKEMDSLPKGYISKKIIKGRQYSYLQMRQAGKIVSKFIPAQNIEAIEKQVERRNQLKMSINEIDKNLKKIERVRR
jgi:hypothetical protein